MTREEESVAAIILFSQSRLKWRTTMKQQSTTTKQLATHQRPTTNFFTQGQESTTKAHTHTQKKKERKKAMSPQKGNTHARALRKKEGDGDA